MHYGDLGQHRLPYCDHLYRCCISSVFLACEWGKKKGKKLLERTIDFRYTFW